MIFRFGRFELDESTRELRLGARALELQPRTFDLLVFLVRNNERVVSKDELLSALWPDPSTPESCADTRGAANCTIATAALDPGTEESGIHRSKAFAKTPS